MKQSAKKKKICVFFLPTSSCCFLKWSDAMICIFWIFRLFVIMLKFSKREKIGRQIVFHAKNRIINSCSTTNSTTFLFVISDLGSNLHCFSENQCCFHESQCYTRKIPASSSVTLIKISKTIFTRKNGFYKRSLRKKLIICVTFVDAHLL